MFPISRSNAFQKPCMDVNLRNGCPHKGGRYRGATHKFLHRLPTPGMLGGFTVPPIGGLVAALARPAEYGRRVRAWPALRRLLSAEDSETSRVIVGSTGSGKSDGELVDLVRLADRRNTAVILLDGHGPLALSAAGHWAHRGHEGRIVYEPLDATDRVLAFEMIPPSDTSDPLRRAIEEAEHRDELAQCFMNQRSLVTLTDRAWTKEWLEAALTLCLAQPQAEPLTSLLHAFRVGTRDYERLLRDCRDAAVVAKFRDAERLKQRSLVQYETVTSPARRLVESVCASEVVRLRSRPGPFDWLEALRHRRLIAFDGGGIRSRELKRSVFLLVTMHVLHAVRRHFSETHRPLPVVLVLEEAGALGLVTPFVLGALQELRKAGLAVHILTQSSLDFGDPSLFQLVLSNTPWQAWYQCLAPADQELGATVLTNAAFHPHALHFTRPRGIPDGDTFTAPWRGRMRRVLDPYYKSPSLQEQEFRTRLATLRVGERYVRDRRRVRRERVRMLRPPRVPGGFDAYTRTDIERIRRQPVYLPPLPVETVAASEPLPDAAARLRAAEGG